MAALWRAIRRGKNEELNNRAALTAAIHSGDDGELSAAIDIARQECVQWKGALSMTHDQMSSRLLAYLAAPFPKQTRDKDEIPVTPLSLARDLRHDKLVRLLMRDIEKFGTVAEQGKNAQLKSSANHGKSTNERAEQARQRLRKMQKKMPVKSAADDDEESCAVSTSTTTSPVNIGSQQKSMAGRYQVSSS
mmetsp:Transcript_64244/g.126187  ORF Transcript_64244/g.126187 Transcript_64244/m.126187 type:complete len:191 (+) Transcript_64244:95-667(+)